MAPRSADAHLLLSLYATFEHRHEDAVAHARDAVALEPEHVAATFLLARTLRRAGRWREAAPVRIRAGELDPRLSTGRLGPTLGRVPPLAAVLALGTVASLSIRVGWANPTLIVVAGVSLLYLRAAGYVLATPVATPGGPTTDPRTGRPLPPPASAGWILGAAAVFWLGLLGGLAAASGLVLAVRADAASLLWTPVGATLLTAAVALARRIRRSRHDRAATDTDADAGAAVGTG